MKKIRYFIATKDFYQRVLKLAIPLMLQQLIMSSVNLIDNLMVGQLGTEAVGAVGAINKFYMIVLFATFAITEAASIFISQFLGANDEEKVKQSFRYSLIGNFVLILPFFVFGYLFPETIMSLFTKNEVYIQLGVNYFSVSVFTLLPMIFIVALSKAMRTLADTKRPLFANVIAVFVNTFFNYCLIFGNFNFPRLGVIGAAVATLIARVVEMGLLFVFVLKNDYCFKTKIKDLFKIDLKLVKMITLKALPLCLNEILFASGMTVALIFYATRGEHILTAFSIVSTTSDMFFVLFSGMATATTIIVGQHLGANELEEGKRSGYQLLFFSLMISIVFSALMFVSSYLIPNLYDIDEGTKFIAQNVIKIMACLFWIYMANAQIYFILRAGGDTRSTLFMDSFYMWLVNIPVLAFLSYFTNFNVFVVYICGQLTDLFKMIIAFWLLRKETWVKNLTNF